MQQLNNLCIAKGVNLGNYATQAQQQLRFKELQTYNYDRFGDKKLDRAPVNMNWSNRLGVITAIWVGSPR